MLKLAGIAGDSIVDGPGIRTTYFAQGCPHHCEGCHNPGTHDPAGGKELSTEEIIKTMLSNPLTDGLTLSGGDPFFQPEPCAEIARAAKAHGLNVWAYTGWTFDQLLADPRPAVRALLEQCDVLVDGPFVLAQRSLALKWRGSANQRILDVPRSLAAGIAVDYDG